MPHSQTFDQRVQEAQSSLGPAEVRVADYLSVNRETALHASAAKLAQDIGTSDATVIRTVKRLGYAGLSDLRHALAAELRAHLTLADRMAHSLSPEGAGQSVLALTLAQQRLALDALEQGTAPAKFNQALDLIGVANRLVIFGIGPSGHLAGYFADQMMRLGAEALALGNTGLRFADDLLRLRRRDLLLVLAYDRPYPEVTALFDRAAEIVLPTILITAPATSLPDHRADLVLYIARGKSEGFSLHAGTLALLEALLVGHAARHRASVLKSLDDLNRMRVSLSEKRLKL